MNLKKVIQIVSHLLQKYSNRLNYTKLIKPESKTQLARKFNEFHLRSYRRQQAMATMAQIEERIRHHNCTSQDLEMWLNSLINNL